MNEPKRRGRPPKALVESMEKTKEAVTTGPFAAAVVDAMADKGLSILAQAYALRVWNGQSSDVKRDERIRRVKLALEGQNLPFEGVELP